MQIKVISDSDITNDERKLILKFIFKCFGVDNTEDRKLLYYSPTYKHLFLYKNQQLISYLRTVKREVEFEGGKILVGGIGDVSTHPSHRGKGYASKLLERARQIFTKENFDIGLLQTNVERGGGLYEKIGFVPANKAYQFIDSNGKLHTTKAKDVMIAPINSKEKMKKILQSHKSLNIGKGDW